MPVQHMAEPATSRLYDLWAWFYDYTFGALVHARHLKAVAQLRPEPGDRVLDLGVGTGMTLEAYPDNVTVVGIDLSPGMLAKADRKRHDQGLGHVHLCQGDAMHPPFADHSFDHIVITHTISVVSEPNRLMQWAQRMLKPGGTIILLNHFRSANRFVAFWEEILNPIFIKIGWRSDLPLAECLDGIDLHLHYAFKTTYFDLWQIVVLGSTPAPAPGSAPRATGPGRVPLTTGTESTSGSAADAPSTVSPPPPSTPAPARTALAIDR